MTDETNLDNLPPEAQDFTAEDIAEAERIYQEKLNKNRAEIAQDNTGMLKRIFRLSAFRDVKAKKDQQAQPLQPQKPPLQKSKPKTPEKETIQLSLALPERARPMSNAMVRAALFAAIQGENRELLDNATLASQDGIKIIFSGRQLNQDDHDVFMQLLSMAIHKPLGEEVTVTANSVLAGLERKKGGKDHEQLKEEIHRLVKATINIKCNGINFIGHLVDSAFQDEREPQNTRHWRYRLNPEIVPLFSNNQYTLVDWEQRNKLKQKDLAKWLHLYYSSHENPFPVSVEFLRDKSGSKTKELKHFRTNLRKALNALVEIGFLSEWQIDKSDLVHVKRVPRIALLHQSEQNEITPPNYLFEKHLKPATIEKFRKLYSGFDPYACKGEFDIWLAGKTAPNNYDTAFLGFAAKWVIGKI